MTSGDEPSPVAEDRRGLWAHGVTVMTVAAGLLLGVLGFGADWLPGAPGALLEFATSSGTVWGGAAMLAGAFSHRRVVASINGLILLVAAVIVYYTLTFFVSQRWRLGYAMEGDGVGQPDAGLQDFLWIALVWLAAAILCGVGLGYLGSVIRSSSRIAASCAAGIGWGLLASQGSFMLIFAHGWVKWDTHGRDIFFKAAYSVLLSVAVIAVMVGARRGRLSWMIVVAVGIVALAFATGLWAIGASVRSSAY